MLTTLGKWTLSFLLATCLVACTDAHNISTDNTTSSIQALQQHDDFMEIFHNATELGNRRDAFTYDVSLPVGQYIKSCCRTKDQAIVLLRHNGFNIGPSETYNPKQPGTHGTYTESIVGAKRGDSFLYSWKSYRVILYVEAGTVKSVEAFSFNDSL